MPTSIPDDEAVRIVFDLIAEEGLCLGASIWGQHRRRHQAGARTRPRSSIVTILCDYGTRYQSRLFNPEFLRVQVPPRGAMAWQDNSTLPSVFIGPNPG